MIFEVYLLCKDTIQEIKYFNSAMFFIQFFNSLEETKADQEFQF